MAQTPYIYERQSEYWTSRQIEEFFLDLRFEVLSLPISQVVEKGLPADYIFFDKGRSKLFGLQYKALYRNGRDCWFLDKIQHHTLKRYPWIYYCLSELKKPSEHRIALHLARIVDSKFEFREKISLKGEGQLESYKRWGAFYQGLEQCYLGVRVRSEHDLKMHIGLGGEDRHLGRLAAEAADLFLADFDSGKMIHFSPFLH